MTEILDRIAAHLVGLRMPRALEALGPTVQRIEKGEISALEAIDTLLAEELTIRESRRIGVAMATARLTPPKTLEGLLRGVGSPQPHMATSASSRPSIAAASWRSPSSTSSSAPRWFIFLARPAPAKAISRQHSASPRSRPARASTAAPSPSSSKP